MNKQYATPTAELLSFSYRDQVVAASGVEAYSDEVYEPSKREQIQDILADGYDLGDFREIIKIIIG